MVGEVTLINRPNKLILSALLEPGQPYTFSPLHAPFAAQGLRTDKVEWELKARIDCHSIRRFADRPPFCSVEHGGYFKGVYWSCIFNCREPYSCFFGFGICVLCLCLLQVLQIMHGVISRFFIIYVRYFFSNCLL